VHVHGEAPVGSSATAPPTCWPSRCSARLRHRGGPTGYSRRVTPRCEDSAVAVSCQPMGVRPGPGRLASPPARVNHMLDGSETARPSCAVWAAGPGGARGEGRALLAIHFFPQAGTPLVRSTRGGRRQATGLDGRPVSWSRVPGTPTEVLQRQVTLTVRDPRRPSSGEEGLTLAAADTAATCSTAERPPQHLVGVVFRVARYPVRVVTLCYAVSCYLGARTVRGWCGPCSTGRALRRAPRRRRPCTGEPSLSTPVRVGRAPGCRMT